MKLRAKMQVKVCVKGLTSLQIHYATFHTHVKYERKMHFSNSLIIHKFVSEKNGLIRHVH